MYILKQLTSCWLLGNRQRLHITRKCSQLIQSILMKLEDDIDQNKLFDVPNSLKKLELVSSEWPHKVQGQALISSVVHGLRKLENHDDLNLVVKALQSVNYYMWGGLSTVVLYSYMDQKRWQDVLELFEVCFIFQTFKSSLILIYLIIVQSIQRLKSANPKLIHIKLEFVLKCS